MPISGNRMRQPTDEAPTVMLPPKASARRRVLFILALIGAIVVVSLYLLVPLMILFGSVRDLVTQLLGALLLLTIAEFIIVNILMRTARSMKPISAKMQAALLNSQDTDNVPFDIIANASTTTVPAQQPEDSTTAETLHRIRLPRDLNNVSGR